MTLDDLRKECGWSISELSRRASLDYNTVNRALHGVGVSGRTAVALAQALSEGLGRTVRYQDIQGLVVNL